MITLAHAAQFGSSGSLRRANAYPDSPPPRIRRVLFTLALVLVLCMLSCTSGSSANADKLGLDEAAKHSNLIVVARVLGLADSKPAAQTRRNREVHLIEVERTLKGFDMSGQQLAVRPNSITWEDGASYLFFLNSELPVSAMTQPVLPQPVLPATPANVDGVAKVVSAQGGTVSPRLILWMSEDSGFGIVRDLTLVETGSFHWRRYEHGNTIELTGMLESSAIDMLLSQIAGTATTIPPDDAAFIVFNWLDDDQVVHSKTFPLNSPDTAMLLRRTEQLLGVD